MSPFTFDAVSGEIPIGQHDVEIVEARAGVNQNSGNDNLRVTFEARDGSQLADYWTKTEKARWRWSQLWISAGLDWPSDDQGGTIDERDLLGRRVHITVVEDTYTGQVRRKVKEVGSPIGSDIPTDDLPVGGGFAAAAGIDDDEEAAF
jgi:hypothetical protein